MGNLLKKINRIAKGDNMLYWWSREQFVVWSSRLQRVFDRPHASKKRRILFYHIHSLGFGGTEKLIQIFAKHLDKSKYEVYYMYPVDRGAGAGSNYLPRYRYVAEGGVILLPFTYHSRSEKPPYFVKGMNPDIMSLIRTLHIDVLVVPDSGHANYPFSIIKDIPIVLFNIFGQPNVQKNIGSHICISKEVANKLVPIVPNAKMDMLPVPLETPQVEYIELGKKLRASFGIKDTDIVFGRIGRPDDGIFDPIGIEAFIEASQGRDDMHYIIMAPPPILRKLISDKEIKHVHIIEPSSKESDVWAFHYAIDTLAHFRLDGESFGLNIAEAMLAGRPIITHKSHIWNAHLEYLDGMPFARIAEQSDIGQYAEFMREFADLHQKGQLSALGIEASKVANEKFHIDVNIKKFEDILERLFLSK